MKLDGTTGRNCCPSLWQLGASLLTPQEEGDRKRSAQIIVQVGKAVDEHRSHRCASLRSFPETPTPLVSLSGDFMKQCSWFAPLRLHSNPLAHVGLTTGDPATVAGEEHLEFFLMVEDEFADAGGRMAMEVCQHRLVRGVLDVDAADGGVRSDVRGAYRAGGLCRLQNTPGSLSGVGAAGALSAG